LACAPSSLSLTKHLCAPYGGVRFLEGVVKKRLIMLISLISSIAYFVWEDWSGLGNGYEFKSLGRSDYRYITKNNKIYIKNAILDLNVIDKYVVGLQLPMCKNAPSQKIVLSVQKTYFILNTEIDNVIYFASEDKFVDELKRLELFEQVSLNYHFFNNMIEATQENYRRFFTKKQIDECNQI